MERHDIEFDLTYSYHLENMFSTITGRIDRAITLITIVAGFSIFSSVAGHMWFGGLIAVLSVTQIVYQFSRASGISEQQARKYLALLTEKAHLGDDDLLTKYKDLQNSDSNPWGILKNTAFKRACIVLGLKDRTPKLTKVEILFSIMAGDLPKN